MSAWSLAQGEVAEVLREYRDNSFDALLCDPPYGFSFMGKSWDYDVPSVELWRECLRVLKPGAPLVAFGGSRTYHRLACGIEDAGFELRDMCMWLYGKGFPKSLNIGLALDKSAGAAREVVGSRTLSGTAAMSTQEKGGTYTAGNDSRGFKKEVAVTAPSTALAKAWDGWGTALKPAHEPIVLARKPLDGTVAQNVAKWGVGGLAIDACRIDWVGRASGWSKTGSKASENVAMSGGNYGRDAKPDADGRWPANLILDEDAAALLDAEAGDKPSRPVPANVAEGNVLPFKARTAGGYSDSGGPARFFLQVNVCGESKSPTDDGWCAGKSSEKGSSSTSIGFSGNEPTDQSPTGWRSTTSITTTATTDLKIYNSSPPNGTTTTTRDCEKTTSFSTVPNTDVVRSASFTSPSHRSIDGGPEPSRGIASPAQPNDSQIGERRTDNTTTAITSSIEPVARFHYSAKVSTREREAGCENLPRRSAGEVTGGRDEDAPGLDSPRAGAGRTGGAHNHHSCLKPLSLTTWLARLIAPPNAGKTGVILVPFAGAGSEMIGALKAGWSGVFGIEREADYVEIAKARIRHWCRESEAA